MAPNLSDGRVRSEALDRYLSQHDSHESLEVIRDDKKENLDLLKDDYQQTAAFAADVNSESVNLDETSIPLVEDSDIGSLAEKNVNTDGELKLLVPNVRDPKPPFVVLEPQVKDEAVIVESQPEGAAISSASSVNSGKSLSSSRDRSRLLAALPQDLDSSVAHDPLKNNRGPEEALLKHDSSIGQLLQNQQGALLEKALHETLSITKEEEEWAVVEKQLAEDLSFARALEEILQSSPDSGTQPQRSNPFYPTSSGAPPSLQQPSRQTAPGFVDFGLPDTTLGFGPLDVPAIPGLNIESSMPESGLKTNIRSPRIFSDPPSSSRLQKTNKQPTNPSEIHVISKGNSHITGKPIYSSGSLLPSPSTKPSQSTWRTTTSSLKRTTPSDETTKSTDRRTSSDRKISSTNKKLSTGNRKSTAKTTTASTFSNPNIPVSSSTQTPLGIFRIPGHEPEAPADLNLVHHDLSLPFLKDQGARVLNTEPAMTAQGKKLSTFSTTTKPIPG